LYEILSAQYQLKRLGEAEQIAMSLFQLPNLDTTLVTIDYSEGRSKKYK